MADIDNIIEPLQAVPFNKFHVIYKDPDMRNKIKYHTTVYKYIRKLPIYPAAIDRRWRKGKDEDKVEDSLNKDELSEDELENTL